MPLQRRPLGGGNGLGGRPPMGGGGGGGMFDTPMGGGSGQPPQIDTGVPRHLASATPVGGPEMPPMQPGGEMDGAGGGMGQSGLLQQLMQLLQGRGGMAR